MLKLIIVTVCALGQFHRKIIEADDTRDLLTKFTKELNHPSNYRRQWQTNKLVSITILDFSLVWTFHINRITEAKDKYIRTLLTLGITGKKSEILYLLSIYTERVDIMHKLKCTLDAIASIIKEVCSLLQLKTNTEKCLLNYLMQININNE